VTDVSLTAASVVAGNTATIVRGIAAASITAGQILYLDPTTGKYGLADTDSATAAVRTVAGVALHAAAANQPIALVTAGPVTIGATIAAGVFYYASGTAGGICPIGDVAPGDYPSVVGYGLSTTVLQVDINNSGVVLL